MLTSITRELARLMDKYEDYQEVTDDLVYVLEMVQTLRSKLIWRKK
jgi:hypothetical protein